METGNEAGFDAIVHSPAATPSATALPRPKPERESLAVLLWERLATTPLRARLLRWAGPVLVGLLAAGTRLWHLADPHTLVFDETFYVKDAYTLLNLGYESQWPKDTDPLFATGQVDGYSTDASFVVHPPLGKWLIALGFLIFEVQDSLSWRISTAMVGILMVVLLMVIVKGLFHSTLVATIAGTLLAIDGNAIVMSRVALLDNFGAFFALLGFGAILLDRAQSAGRLAVWIAAREKRGPPSDWGAALWWRPWLVAAGIAFGLASAVKWNGLYFLAGLAVYTLIVDMLARRRAGIGFWFGGTILKQAPVSFLLTVPVALAVYLLSWTGWFLTNGGYDRNWAAEPGNALTGPFSWLPLALQSFWHMQTEVYNYHINEHSGHPYAANPLTWLLLLRPTSMYFEGSNLGENGCTTDFCGSAITGIANPIIWWAGVASAVYLLYRLLRLREWRAGLILAGLAVGYLPWLLYLNRTVYQFYTIAFEPYLVLAIAYVAWQLLGSRDDPVWLRKRGGRLIAVFLLVAVAVSVFFWPMWTAIQIDWPLMNAHYWLPSWR